MPNIRNEVPVPFPFGRLHQRVQPANLPYTSYYAMCPVENENPVRELLITILAEQLDKNLTKM